MRERPQTTPNQLAYLDRGDGPTVLLLHGFTGTAQTHFAALIENLSRDHRVIAPDLRGYGASRPPERTFPPDFYQRDADDCAAVLEALMIENAVVMGFSDGAESALLLAARHPKMVTGVVAWGVSGVISKAMADSVRSWLTDEDWAKSHPEWAAEIAAAHGADRILPLVQGWAARANAIYAAGGNICLEEAATIRSPVLLLNGEGETGNIRADLDTLAARIPDGRAHVVSGAGHAIHWDQPHVFTTMIRGFLQQQGPNAH